MRAVKGLFVGVCWKCRIPKPTPPLPVFQSGMSLAERRPHPTGPEARRSPHCFLPPRLHPDGEGTRRSFPKIPKGWNQHLELSERTKVTLPTILCADQNGSAHWLLGWTSGVQTNRDQPDCEDPMPTSGELRKSSRASWSVMSVTVI